QGARALEEVLGRRERLDLEAAGAEETAQRPEERDVVVDDTDKLRAVILAGRSGSQPTLPLRANPRAGCVPPPCVVGPIRPGRLAGSAEARGRVPEPRRRTGRRRGRG